MLWIRIAVFVFLICTGVVNSYPSSLSCSTKLNAGTYIMSSKAVNSDSRSVIVKRGSANLVSGSSYVAGETLTISISATGGQWIFEASNAQFVGGSCTDKFRSNSFSPTSASLKMPSSGTVTVKVAWASSQNVVSISSVFTLLAPIATVSPTPTPTVNPTVLPTVLPTKMPTVAPSAAATRAPTAIPTNPAPTAGPSLPVPTAVPTTHPPSTTPSLVPTSIPTKFPTASPSTKPTSRPTAHPTTRPSSYPTSIPTTLANVRATFTASQTFSNVSVDDFDDSKSSEALSRAVASSVPGMKPGDIEVLSVSETFLDEHHARTLLGPRPPNAVLVTFLISFYSSTGEDGLSTRYESLSFALSAALSDVQFTATLQDIAASIGANSLLYAVGSLVVPTISDPTIIPHPTPGPTLTPAAALTDEELRVGILGIVCALGIPLMVLILSPAIKLGYVLGAYSVTVGALLVVLIAFMAAWATNNSSGLSLHSIGFLGRPNWADNIFAYHPVLMVAGFYVGQLLAVVGLYLFPLDWFVIPVSLHTIGHVVAVISFGIGIAAVTKHKQQSQSSSHVTSLHSWLGVTSIIAYALNLCLEVFVGISKDRVNRSVRSSVRNNHDTPAAGGVIHVALPQQEGGRVTVLTSGSLNLLLIHRSVGLISIGITAITIIVGISEQFGQYGCMNPNVAYGLDPNPGAHYSSFPIACRLAFGAGLLTFLSATLVVIAVTSRESWIVRSA